LNTVLNTDDGKKVIFSFFVGASLPAPINDTCDNSSPTRGLTLLHGFVTVIGQACLNPSPIPAATVTDPQFAISESGSTTRFSRRRSRSRMWTER
jgi:hypothetical protein